MQYRSFLTAAIALGLSHALDIEPKYDGSVRTGQLLDLMAEQARGLAVIPFRVIDELDQRWGVDNAD